MAMLAPVFILSGPSASGKSTVLTRLLAEKDVPLRLSVSATTRPARKTERDGIHYHFWTRQRFEDAVAAGAFLEWADVFGNLYGTLVSEVQPFREQGTSVILDIDVQGAAQVRQKCPEAVTFFLRTSSQEIYEKRLRARGTESEAAIQRRLEGARRELERSGEYQYVVINDDLDTAVAQLRALIRRHFPRGDHAR
jgi:guanylate kinase